jgi:hypothetical protein
VNVESPRAAGRLLGVRAERIRSRLALPGAARKRLAPRKVSPATGESSSVDFVFVAYGSDSK